MIVVSQPESAVLEQTAEVPDHEAALLDLRRRILIMAGQVEGMIAASVQSLSERDADQARTTIAADARVNTAECDIDEHCLKLLAGGELADVDLRFVTLALKMVTDLERIGDLAVNICERALDLNHSPPLPCYEDLHRMAITVRGMVRDAIDAFVDADPDKANRVIARDDQVDALYRSLFQQILEHMRADPSTIERGIHVQSVAKWLERMADHSTNLAEQVVFMVHGKDIRHQRRLTRDR
jgi:phosphate transport system protein